MEPGVVETVNIGDGGTASRLNDDTIEKFGTITLLARQVLCLAFYPQIVVFVTLLFITSFQKTEDNIEISDESMASLE